MAKTPATRKRSTGRKTKTDRKAQIAQAKKLVADGLTKSEAAEKMGMRPNQFGLLFLEDEVARKPRLRIKYTDDDDLAQKAIAAREAADEYSAWGWIAVRAGTTEPRIKRLVEAAGYKGKKGTNIASVRSDSNGDTPAKRGGQAKAGRARQRRGGRAEGKSGAGAGKGKRSRTRSR